MAPTSTQYYMLRVLLSAPAIFFNKCSVALCSHFTDKRSGVEIVKQKLFLEKQHIFHQNTILIKAPWALSFWCASFTRCKVSLAHFNKGLNYSQEREKIVPR